MSFVDLTGWHAVTPRGGVAIVDTPNYFSAQSASFAGVAWVDVAVGARALWIGGADDFSVEVSIRAASLDHAVYDYFGAHQIYITADGRVQVWSRDEMKHSSAPGLIVAGQAYWLEWSRAAGVTRIFVDGALGYVGADAFVYRNLGGDATRLTIGGLRYVDTYPGHDWRGELAFFRLTRTARHVAPYTPSGPVWGDLDPHWGATEVFVTLGGAAAGSAPVLPSIPLADGPGHGDIKTFFFDLTTTADYALDGLLLATDDGLTTAVVLSLFTDARAEADDPIPQGDADRRGWWGDAWPMVPGESMGSRLWLAWPGKQTADNLARAREAAEEALHWLVDDSIAQAVTVQATNPRDGVLALAVSIEKPDGEALSLRFESLWS